MNDKPIYFYLHIPKTAGTTFRKHIQKNLKSSEYLEIYPHNLNLDTEFNIKKYKKTVNKLFSKLSQKQINKLKIVYGHILPVDIYKHFKRPARFFTFLRDPEKRIVSTYNYLYTTYLQKDNDIHTKTHLKKIFLVNNRVPDFDEWCKKKFKNSRDFFLLDTPDFLEKQGYSLDKFFFIGLTENFDEDSLFIYKELGFNKFFLDKNVSGKAVKELSAKQKTLIKKNHKKAFEQYRKAKLINKSQKNNLEFMKLKRELLMPITQTLFDFPEYIHRSSSFLRKKSRLYSQALDFLKERVK